MSSGSSGSFIHGVREEIEEYIEAKTTLFQLDATEKVSRIAGVVGILSLISLLALLILLCSSLMAGYYFAQLLESNFYGFAVVAGFYLLILLIVWIRRKKLATFITNKMIGILFQKTNNPGE